MRTEFPSVNAMGVRPESGSRAAGGNDSKGRIGETRATGVVATGRFGGSREMEGKVRAAGKGRSAGRRERGR